MSEKEKAQRNDARQLMELSQQESAAIFDSHSFDPIVRNRLGLTNKF